MPQGQCEVNEQCEKTKKSMKNKNEINLKNVRAKKKSIKKCVSKEQQVNAIHEFQENAKIEGVCWRCYF